MKTVVACLGDSITEGSPGWDRVTGGDEQSSWEYWAEQADPRISFANHGIYGQRADEIAARFDEAAAGAGAIVVQGGINDIAQGLPVEPAAENLQALVRRAKALGLPVALANVLPWNNGWPQAETPIRRLNALLAELDAPLLAFHDTLEDPERPGRMREEWSSDGDHPSVEGYRLLGLEVARWTLASLPA
jgi:lysophospholipase L1-like esterase